MSSSDQGHSTDNDNQMPTDSPDATGSLATDPKLSKYSNFTLLNCFEYTCPADVYKRFRNNKVEQEQFKLGPWEVIGNTGSHVLNAFISRCFTKFDGKGLPNEMFQTIRGLKGSVQSRYSSTTQGDNNPIWLHYSNPSAAENPHFAKYLDFTRTQYTSPADIYMRFMDNQRENHEFKIDHLNTIYFTHSEVLDARIERCFKDFDGQGFPSTMEQIVKQEGEEEEEEGSILSRYSWVVGADDVFESLEHNESDMKLQCLWEEPRVRAYGGNERSDRASYTVCSTKARQSEKRPKAARARVHELAKTMVERMVQARQQRRVSSTGEATETGGGDPQQVQELALHNVPRLLERRRLPVLDQETLNE